MSDLRSQAQDAISKAEDAETDACTEIEAARKALNLLMKRRRDAFKAQGRCTDCGAPTDNGHANCRGCRRKRNDRRRLRRSA